MASVYKERSVVGNPAMDLPLRKAHGCEFIRITPEIAQHWLTFNPINRRVNAQNYDKIKTAMMKGAFVENGDTIRFAYGRLIDGQHRLKAIAETGLTFRCLVVCGLDPEVLTTIDTNQVKTARSMLEIEGLDDWSAVVGGTAIHTIIAYETGRVIYSSLKFTNREVRDYYLEHQARFDTSLRFVKALPRRKPVVVFSRVLALHYLFAKKDAEQATRFFDGLITGADLAKSSPVYQLRQLLDQDMKADRKRSGHDQLFLIVKAWNSFRSGSSLRSASALYPRDGDSFPEIK